MAQGYLVAPAPTTATPVTVAPRPGQGSPTSPAGVDRERWEQAIQALLEAESLLAVVRAALLAR